MSLFLPTHTGHSFHHIQSQPNKLEISSMWTQQFNNTQPTTQTITADGQKEKGKGNLLL